MEDKKRLPSEEYQFKSFADGNYEIVRSQFFSHSTEPAITFGRQKMWVNSICLAKFSETDYIQILVNKDTKVLILRPSQENAKDALPWCSAGSMRRKPRHLSCPVFFAMVCELMRWNPDCRYRVTGKYLFGNETELLAFDLRLAEAYVYGENTAQRHAPHFPADWRDQFGIPETEHDTEPLVRIFDGYTVFKLGPPEVKPDISAVQTSKGEDTI